MTSSSVNGVVLINYRVSGSKGAAKAAQDTAREYETAGKKSEKAATGLDRFNRGLDQAAKKSSHWLEGAKGIAAGWLGINAAFEAKDFIQDSIHVAAESQALQKSLAITLQNTTHATKDQVKEVGEWLEKTGMQYGKTKAELIPAYQSLVTATHNVEKAHELMSTAMDIAAGKHISVAEAAKALAKAQNGNVGALSRLGIATKVAVGNDIQIRNAKIGVINAIKHQNDALAKYGAHSGQYEAATFRMANAQALLKKAQEATVYKTLSAKEAIELASKTYKGQAAAAAATYQGSLDRLKVRMEGIKDFIGTHLIPVLAGVSGWFLGNIKPISIFAGVILGVVAAYKTYKGILWLANAAQTAWNTVQGIGVFISGNAAASYEIEGAALNGYMLATKVATAGTWLLNVASKALRLTMLALPWVAIAAAVVFVVYLIIKHWKTIEKAIVSVAHFVVGVFKGAWNGIKEAAGAAFNWVVGLWSGITGFFGKIVNAVSSAFTSMGHGISSAFSSVWNGIIGGVKSAINGMIGLINTAINFINSKLIDTANQVPFVNIPHIPDIPTLATGGRVYPSGRVVQIAEGGEPETVLKDSQIASLMVKAQRMKPGAMPGAPGSGGTGGGRQVEIPVYLDGLEVGRGVISAAQLMGALT